MVFADLPIEAAKHGNIDCVLCLSAKEANWIVSKLNTFFSKGGEASIQFSPIIALQFLVINSIDKLKIYDNHREGKTY